MPWLLAHPVTAEDRDSFKRCRRQWDLGSAGRRNLEPAAKGLDLERAIKDALAVYYFPGMWDWSRAIVLPLVMSAFVRSVAEQRDRCPSGTTDDGQWTDGERLGRAVLESYMAWAPTLDRFSPIQVETDLSAIIEDPDHPEQGLLAGSEAVQYQAHLDLIVVDANDLYWVVEHRLGTEWAPDEQLVLAEAAVSTSWAWEYSYVGMEIAGTIHNEVRTTGLAERPVGASATGDPARGGIDQNEPSGGGRFIPQHRRLYVTAREQEPEFRMVQESGGPLRRTVIRRTPAELAAMTRRIGNEAREMVDPGLVAYPSPSTHCSACPFVAPCLAITEGRDPEPILAAGYRARPPLEEVSGRLGAKTWSIGRGAAPPRFTGRA